jgi:hypothetical protein
METQSQSTMMKRKFQFRRQSYNLDGSDKRRQGNLSIGPTTTQADDELNCLVIERNIMDSSLR